MRARILQSCTKLLAPSLLATLLVTATAFAQPQPDAPAAVPAPAPAPAPAPVPVPAPATAADDAGKPCEDHDCEHDEKAKPCGAKDCDRPGRPDARHGGEPCCDDDETDGDDEPCERGDHHGKGEGHDGKPCCGDCERAHAGKGPGRGHGGGHGGRGGFGGSPIRPEALLQFQAAYPFGDETTRRQQLVAGDRAERPGFAMRTARLGLSGKFGPHARFVLDTDLVKIRDVPVTQAYIGLAAWRGAEWLVGAQKLPFSRFAMLGSGEQALIERPFATQAMAPFYQLGATLTGHYPRLAGIRWYAGAYNSFERRANFFQGVQENSGLTGNRFGGLAYAGRIQLEPLGKLGRSVADIDSSRFKFEVGGGFLYNDSGTTDTQAMSVDAQVKFRGAHLLVEFLQDWAHPSKTPETPLTIPARLQRRAMIGELGYAFRHLNAAVRVEQIDPNTDVKDSRDEVIVSAALGVQAMRNRARFQLQFDHRAESQSSAQNDSENDTLFAQFQWKL